MCHRDLYLVEYAALEEETSLPPLFSIYFTSIIRDNRRIESHFTHIRMIRDFNPLREDLLRV